MAKKSKVYSLADMGVQAEYEKVALKDLVGKTIIIVSAVKRDDGEYGDGVYYIANLKDGTSFATSGVAITKYLDKAIAEDMFPIKAKMNTAPSKKRKGKSYFFLT